MRPPGVARAARLVGTALVGAVLTAAALAGCAEQDTRSGPEARLSGGPTGSPSASHTPAPTELSTGPAPDAAPDAPSDAASDAAAVDPPAVDPPPRLTERLLPADLLVQVQRTLSAEEIARVRRLAGIDRLAPLSLAQVGVQDRVLTLAAVDVAQYRRFTPRWTASHQTVWERVAGGEVAVDPGVARRLWDAEEYLRLGNDQGAPRVHVGASATQVPQVDAVLNSAWGEELGMWKDNALLISTGTAAPQVVRPRVERLLGRLLGEEVSVQVLGPDLDVTAVQTAYLAGGSVAAAVGSFTYRVLPGGRIAPDAGWVADNIATEEVPILGAVTCHRMVLPQLRAALGEIQDAGLAAKIHVDQYAGCFQPRFIAGSSSLSLHAFGIALDLNVPGNQRGTVGRIDRNVVAIFERWGFAWGGRWSWTDPMHFELDRLVEAR